MMFNYCFRHRCRLPVIVPFWLTLFTFLVLPIHVLTFTIIQNIMSVNQFSVPQISCVSASFTLLKCLKTQRNTISCVLKTHPICLLRTFVLFDAYDTIALIEKTLLSFGIFCDYFRYAATLLFSKRLDDGAIKQSKLFKRSVD